MACTAAAISAAVGGSHAGISPVSRTQPMSRDTARISPSPSSQSPWSSAMSRHDRAVLHRSRPWLGIGKPPSSWPDRSSPARRRSRPPGAGSLAIGRPDGRRGDNAGADGRPRVHDGAVGPQGDEGAFQRLGVKTTPGVDPWPSRVIVNFARPHVTSGPTTSRRVSSCTVALQVRRRHSRRRVSQSDRAHVSVRVSSNRSATHAPTTSSRRSTTRPGGRGGI